MNRLRILLVDDHEVVRLGLATLLEDVPGVEIVGESGSGRTALQLCRSLRPDLVLLDIRLPDENGVEVCRQITEQAPRTKVIILTSYADDELITEAILAGASGYVLKQVGSQELLRAIEAVRRGDALLDPAVTQRVLMQLRQSERLVQSNAFRDLSTREMEVLRLVAEGRSNREIAETLFISERTVGNHVSALLSKLGLGNRVELATYAVKHRMDLYLASGSSE